MFRPALPCWLACAALTGLPACAHLESSPEPLVSNSRPVGVATYPLPTPVARRAATVSPPSDRAASRGATAATAAAAPQDMTLAGYDPPALAPPPTPAAENAGTDRETSPNAAYPPARPADPAAPEILTLAALEEMALANNPTLGMAANAVEMERGLWRQVGLYPNPTLGFVNNTATGHGQQQANGPLLQQTFITGGKLQKNRAVEAWGIQNAQWQLESQRLRVLNDVRLRYYDVLGAQQQVGITGELETLARKSLETAQALFKGKQVAQTDVLQAQVQLGSIALARENAEAEYLAAWQQLAVIVGCPQLPPAPLAQPPAELPEYDLESQWQRLLAESPQLRGSEAAAGLVQAHVVQQEAAPIPDVTLQVVGQYDAAADYGTVNTVVALPIPFYDRNQGNIYEATHELSQAQGEVRRVQLVLRDQLVTTHRDYVQARNQIRRLRDDILPNMRKNLDLLMSSFQTGELGYPPVLAAQQAYFRTSLDYAGALTRARRLEVQISGLQLTGGLNPASIGTAIQETGGNSRIRAVQAEVEKQRGNQLKTFVPAAIQ